MLKLDQILQLVGTLDDTEGPNGSGERFRAFLKDNIAEVGSIRDYVEYCLRTSGPQYNRALQDLVNHIGRLLGFEVVFGRYQGVQNAIGYDGIWKYEDFYVVVEVKTTTAYTIDTATLFGYIDRLINEGTIPDREHALGLYIVGRADKELKTLEYTVIGQNRTRELRVSSVNSILSLAEMVEEGYITTQEALGLIKPSGVIMDNTVDLIARIASSAVTKPEIPDSLPVQYATERPILEDIDDSQDANYIVTPVKAHEAQTVQECLTELLGKGWYVFGEKTPNRKILKPGDWICFYESSVGVVAEAQVASTPEISSLPSTISIRYPDLYPWAFQVKNVRFFFDTPVVIDQELRSRLDAFRGRDLTKPWAWFIQSTNKLTKHDYEEITQRNMTTTATGPI